MKLKNIFLNIKDLSTKSVDFISALFCVDRKFVKFLFVGGINTLFGYLMYSIFISTPLPRFWALLCAYIIGILWNFKTTGVIVFKNHDNGLIFKFFFSYVITFLINYFCLNGLAVLNINKYLAQLILVFPIAVISFILFKYFVFKNS